MNQRVVLYRPNLIGYLRLLLLFGSIFTHSNLFVLLYVLSVSLDYFDGMAARVFSEESVLGACLDMITDRVSTTVLCMKLMHKEPVYSNACSIYVFFDIIGHFLYFLAMSRINSHHKTPVTNNLLRIYYHTVTLRVMCCGSEISFILLYYLEKVTTGLNVLTVIPLIKTVFHVVHMYVGMSMLSYV